MKNIKDLNKYGVDNVRLRELRGSTSRGDVGAMIGVGSNQIANYEYGIRIPPGDKLLKLMMLFNVTPQQIAKIQPDEK